MSTFTEGVTTITAAEWRMLAECWASGDWGAMEWTMPLAWTATWQLRWVVSRLKVGVQGTRSLVKLLSEGGLFKEPDMVSEPVLEPTDLALLCMSEAECCEEAAS